MNSKQTGLLRLKHLREHNEATDDEMGVLRHRFNELAKPTAAARAVSSFNLFQTPPDLADELIHLFTNRPGRILEPSAGLGRLYHAIRRRWPDSPAVLVEQSPQCCRELYYATEGDRDARLIQGDFLQQTAETLGGQFDTIVMNPPFCRGTDRKHIAHALTLLAPGGALAAICAASERNKRFAVDNGGRWQPLPSGSFRSEGTNVETAFVTFTR